jgi:hypothetical protein
MSGRPLRVLTLLARHGIEKYYDAPERLQELYARQLHNIDHKIIIVDNAQTNAWSSAHSASTTAIGGDNSSWEFSAWDRGLEHLGTSIKNWDLIGLVTSAFQQSHTAYLDRLSEPLLRQVAGRARALGHIDYGSAPVELFGVRTQCWIRSSFLLLPPRELQLLGRVASITDGSAFFSGDAREPFLQDAPLSPQYRQNIMAWLCGEGLGQGTMWHSRFDLTAESLAFFEQKARAILNEQRLSTRLVAQGCQLTDVTWLASRMVAADVPTILPSWRAQITSRDVNKAPGTLLHT